MERVLIWSVFCILAALNWQCVPLFAIVAAPIAALNFQDFASRRAAAPAGTPLDRLALGQLAAFFSFRWWPALTTAGKMAVMLAAALVIGGIFWLKSGSENATYTLAILTIPNVPLVALVYLALAAFAAYRHPGANYRIQFDTGMRAPQAIDLTYYDYDEPASITPRWLEPDDHIALTAVRPAFEIAGEGFEDTGLDPNEPDSVGLLNLHIPATPLLEARQVEYGDVLSADAKQLRADLGQQARDRHGRPTPVEP